jgi:hypothetical protein
MICVGGWMDEQEEEESRYRLVQHMCLPAAPRRLFAGWLYGWLVGWLAGWLAGYMVWLGCRANSRTRFTWMTSCQGRQLHMCLGGLVGGWVAGWLDDCLLGGWVAGWQIYMYD